MTALQTKFVFEGKTKTLLYAGMALGALCLVLTYFGDDNYHTRFWTNFLHNSVYFSGIAFTATLFYAAQITAFAGWMTAIKRIWEAMSQFMIIGLVLMAVIALGLWGHFHHLYHWNVEGVATPGHANFDKIIAGKKSFLNPVFYTIATVGFLGIWYFWANRMRAISLAQDTQETTSFDYYKKARKWAASFLPLGGFLICLFIWQATMSIDAHWYSTMYAWYSMISMFLGAISFCVLMIIYLKSRNHLEWVTREHLHDMGKYLFGISVFWTYLWFDQYMLIWYTNNGEETIYFRERLDHYPVLYWGNLLLNFVTPFFILMRNDTKRKYGTMFFVALIVFFGHWWDYFYMIKPGARINATSHTEVSSSHSTHSDVTAPSTGHEAAGDHHEGTANAGHADASLTPSYGHVNAGDRELNHNENDPNRSFKIGYTIPGLEELGILIGFLSLFLFVFFTHLERAPLLPLKDPYVEETMHHETGVYIPSEGGHGDHH